MVSRTVSLEASAYDRLRAAKRPGESFSATVNRILETSRPSFRVLAGGLTRSDAAKVREAITFMRNREARAEKARLAAYGGNFHGRHT